MRGFDTFPSHSVFSGTVIVYPPFLLPHDCCGSADRWDATNSEGETPSFPTELV